MRYYKKALEDFTLAIELNPDYAQSYLNRAITFRTMEEMDDAAEDFNEFLRLKPNTGSSDRIRKWLNKMGYTAKY
jgi:tetratricopeptide (TPR) repeat protein